MDGVFLQLGEFRQHGQHRRRGGRFTNRQPPVPVQARQQARQHGMSQIKTTMRYRAIDLRSTDKEIYQIETTLLHDILHGC